MRKRDNLHIRDSDSSLKTAFKQTKRIRGKEIKNDKNLIDNNIEFIDNDDEEEKEEKKKIITMMRKMKMIKMIKIHQVIHHLIMLKFLKENKKDIKENYID